MFTISECLHELKAISERGRANAKRRILWSMFFVIIGFTFASPRTVYSQWTTNGNDISNTNTGNVGVGTTAPGAKLTVSSNSQTAPAGQPGTTVQMIGANGIAARLLVDSFGATVSSIDMRRANGTAASPSALFNGDGIGQITWQGYGATSYNSASRAKISAFAAENYTDAAQGAFMTFAVAPRGAITAVEAMRIDATGYVGLGTTVPGYRLDVQGGAVNASGGLCIAGDCKTAWSQVGGGGSQWTTSGSTIYYNTGNVGIGLTSAPTRKLEILGGNIFHQWSTTAGSEYGFYTSINNNHMTSNVYYDGQWKMITTGKAALISTSPFSGSAFNVYADNTSRAANAVPSFSQLLTVTLAGNVGIGTGTPDSLAKLHVYGSGAFGQDIQTTTNDWTRLRFVTPSRTWGFFLDSGTGGLGAGKFGLYDYNATAWRMIFDTAGNVGVGTTAPSYSLDVNGGVNGFRAKAATTSSSDAVAVFENSSAIQMIVRGNGNVGIGQTSPTTKLDVNGTVNATAFTVGGSTLVGSQWATSGTTINYATGNVGIATSTPTEKLHVTGNVKVTGSIDVGGNINAKYQDVAEWVESSQELPAGTVVVLDSSKSNQVVASTQAYDSRVAGVISTQPGVALGERGEGRVLVAATGRVKVKVDATNGPINIGDLLVTSDKEGVAMKSVPVEIGGMRIHRPGTLIGKALEPLAQGTGEILVLLSLQ
ncbi:MAG TPA: hypothetical protein VJ875_26185 [Pyrinomonadaceae bacterium]|nr:hypothetical protein [Pyrinomonadaceae bacterium]